MTSPCLDLHADIIVDADNDQVRNDVQGSDAVQDIGIIERNLFRHLHHSEYDHQVGAATHVSCVEACAPKCTYIWGLRPVSLSIFD